MTTTPPDARRDAVRQLAGEGLSNREIARRTRVSEATVRRWRAADAPPPGNAPATHPDALVVPLDDALRAHLATLADAGFDTPDAAARWALQFVAETVRGALDGGHVPPGVPLTLRATVEPS